MAGVAHDGRGSFTVHVRELLSGSYCNIIVWTISITIMSRPQSGSQHVMSLRERRVLGCAVSWPALRFITASERFVAERVAWHSHDGYEVLMFLRGAAEYEFRGGRRLSLTGDHFLIVPPGVKHRATKDMRSPTVHSSIMIDLSAAGLSGSPFTGSEVDWLRAKIGDKKPVVRTMTPLLRRLARLLHRAVRQYPEANPAPPEAATLRMQIARILIEVARAGDEPSAGKEAEVVASAIAYLERHSARPLQINEVAENAGCSRSRLYTAFKRETGMSPNDWLLRLRVKQADVLLTTTSRTGMDIALAVGFSSLAYFCHVFRKYTGRTPGEHRMHHR